MCGKAKMVPLPPLKLIKLAIEKCISTVYPWAGSKFLKYETFICLHHFQQYSHRADSHNSNVPDRLTVESVQRKSTLLLKKSSLTKDMCKQLRPASSRPPRLYGLLKIHGEGVPLRPIVSNIGTPSYQISKSLAGLLNQFTGNWAYHVKNSFQVRTDIRISTRITR